MSFIIDKGHNISIYSPTCILCKNLDTNNLDLPGSCKAFKDKIPMKIWIGENNHIKKHPNQDNDIIFEKIEKQMTIIKREGK